MAAVIVDSQIPNYVWVYINNAGYQVMQPNAKETWYNVKTITIGSPYNDTSNFQIYGFSYRLGDKPASVENITSKFSRNIINGDLTMSNLQQDYVYYFYPVLSTVTYVPIQIPTIYLCNSMSPNNQDISGLSVPLPLKLDGQSAVLNINTGDLILSSTPKIAVITSGTITYGPGGKIYSIMAVVSNDGAKISGYIPDKSGLKVYWSIEFNAVNASTIMKAIANALVSQG